MAVVVMECGSAWPAPVVEQQQEPTGVTAILQQPNECPAALTLRVTQRLVRLIRRGAVLTAGVITCTDASGIGAFRARAAIASAFATVFRGLGHGRLAIVGARRMSSKTRRELFALADVIRRRLRGTHVAVDVCFA